MYLLKNMIKQNFNIGFLFSFFLILICPYVPLSANLLLEFAGAEQIRLEAIENIRLEKDVIFLKDVVNIYVEDNDLKKKLAQVKIGETPPLGRTKIIDEKDIRFSIKKAHIEIEDIKIVLTEPVSITRASMEISPEFIRTAVKDYIQRHNWVKNSTISIKEINWSGQVVLPKGELECKIRPRNQTDFLGDVPLIIFFIVNGQIVKRVAVVAELEVVANVVVARNPINRGQIIKQSDLALRSLELSQVKGKPVLDMDKIIDKRAIHQIYPEAIILDDDIEIPPVLKRGDTVKIIVAIENLVASARGLVKENGKIGQKIKVVNIDSKKILYAEVIDKHTVKIEF